MPVCGGAGPEPAPDPPAVDGGGHGAGQARLLASRRREDAQERAGLSSSMSISSDIVQAQGQCCGCGSALIWLSWIRFLTGIVEPDPGVRKLTKINEDPKVKPFKKVVVT